MFKNNGKIIKISVEVNGKKLKLNCHEHLFGKYRIKNGRSWSTKMKFSTPTQIFDLVRRWVCANSKEKKQ